MHEAFAQPCSYPPPIGAGNGTERGFTLIEISIVLVVIGLIVGGVLVGMDLIAAAAVRAQVSQIEKYQQAVNTFRGKYGYLPGDIPDPQATQFGFTAVAPRGSVDGSGDGDGLLEGALNAGWCTSYCAQCSTAGETAVAWIDLSTANLIDKKFTTASAIHYPSASGIPNTGLPNYFPKAVIGGNNYIYLWSGGYRSGAPWSGYNAGGDGYNYIGITSVRSISSGGYSVYMDGEAGMTVGQAFSIDSKVDDGLPRAGNILAIYSSRGMYWAIGGGGILDGVYIAADPGSAISGSAVSCFDNSNNASNGDKYSMTQNGGRGVNCALSFKLR